MSTHNHVDVQLSADPHNDILAEHDACSSWTVDGALYSMFRVGPQQVQLQARYSCIEVNKGTSQVAKLVQALESLRDAAMHACINEWGCEFSDFCLFIQFKCNLQRILWSIRAV